MNAFELLSIAVEFRRIARHWHTLVVASRFEQSEIELAIRSEAAFRRCVSRGCLPGFDDSVLSKTKNGSGFYSIVGYDRVFSKDDPENDLEHCFGSSSVRPGLIGQLSGGVFWLIWEDEFASKFDLNSQDLIEVTFEKYSIILESVAATIEAFERRPKNTDEASTINIPRLYELLKEKYGKKSPRESTIRGWRKQTGFPKPIPSKTRVKFYSMNEVSDFSASKGFPFVVIGKEKSDELR